jgi:hypothetical protein
MKRSCVNCKSSTFEKGYPATFEDPGQEDEYVCNNEKIDNNYYDDLIESNDCEYDKIGFQCKHYSPKIVKQCGVCGNTMNRPIIDPFILWVGDWYTSSSIPTCSTMCHKLGTLQYESDKQYCQVQDIEIQEYITGSRR